MLLATLTFSCSDETETLKEVKGENNLLKLSASFSPMTKVTELPNSDAMADNVNGLGLYNVGIYIYYTEDYQNGDLSKPYIRNMECTVENGELLAVLADGQDPEDARIYIYNEMTIVAFYPYNAEMSQPENYFATKADEEKYIITKRDYSQQYYIPYRAQTSTDPTTAYYTVLNFYPKHTYKIEVVVVSDTDFPGATDVQILPNIDPIGNSDTDADGKRESGYDQLNDMPNGGGGSNVWQFVAYLWTEETNVNNIKKGDVLLQSDQLTLIASQDLTVDEQYIYRYGYNMSTGEIFIPTSSWLIHDIPSLEALGATGGGTIYQVCDIDLGEAGEWTPMSFFGGRYDGGGHKISNMTINNPSTPNAGLFGEVRGNATICNVNLVDPVINVTANNTSVGALVGKLGDAISQAEKESLIGRLPEGLSPTVRQALIDEILAGLQNTQSNVIASKVDNATINVTGTGVNVGMLVGTAGGSDENGDYNSTIRDSYATGGTLTLTGSGNAGGLCGLNQGEIIRTYSTTENMDDLGNPLFSGLTNAGNGSSIEDSYSVMPDNNTGVSQMPAAWPSWDTYTDNWPVKTTGWLDDNSSSFWFDNGSEGVSNPILVWERK